MQACANEIAKPEKSKRVQNMSKSRNQCQICSLATCEHHTVQMGTQCCKLSQLRNSQQ